MAILVKTSQPNIFLDDIKQKIDDGDIETWKYDEDGDFTHCVPQWNNIAWFHPYIFNNCVVFGIIGRKKIKISSVEYGVYHGRFIEMLVTHYVNSLSEISILGPSASNKYDTKALDYGNFFK